MEQGADVGRVVGAGCAHLESQVDGSAGHSSSTNLRSTNLRSTDLGGTNLGSTHLCGAYLGSTHLGCPDLGGANLRSTDLVRSTADVCRVVIKIGRLRRQVDIQESSGQQGG
ncbi:pentapeptide repeat-containing protein [Hydrogenophaga sp.]|uniref:pentapeptide repeat-containing protein n=1 Tax=Hydrogenophaga sp. TaxID=1904254 RepID=UPI0034576A86